MSETRYMISDAARQIGVETHVLRNWEEELDIKIGRTELGHRYYTEKTIYLFKKVKELREKGFQLKAIKLLVPEIQKKEEMQRGRNPYPQRKRTYRMIRKCFRYLWIWTSLVSLRILSELW